MNSWWKVACSCAGCVAGIALCVVSAGAATPLVAAAFVGGGATAGFFVGDKADKEVIEREKTLMQDKRYKDAKNELEKQENENNQAEDNINTITNKLNGNTPREKHETDDYLKNQLVIHQSQLDSGKTRITKLRNDVDKLRKDLGGNNSLMSLLGLDKLSFMDKVMIAGGIIVLIYLLKG